MANIDENVIKMAMFSEYDASMPLYDENSATVESKIMTNVIIRIMLNDVFLDRVIFVLAIILATMLRPIRRLVRNS